MENKGVVSVDINWYCVDENGEQCTTYTVGHRNCTEIMYHEPLGEGDRHYCDIFCGEEKLRVFNINRIVF